MPRLLLCGLCCAASSLTCMVLYCWQTINSQGLRLRVLVGDGVREMRFDRVPAMFVAEES
jgi:hypothetical protein